MTMRRSWIDEPMILGGGNPPDEDLEDLHHQGFRGIISLLNEEEQRPNYNVAAAVEMGFDRSTIPIWDFTAPHREQIHRFLRVLHGALKRGKVLVHCQAGIGRTGTMGTAYWINRGLSVEEAVGRIRMGSFPTLGPEQEEALHFFHAMEQTSPPEPIDAVCFDFKGVLADPIGGHLLPEMADLIIELRQRRVRLAVVSSASPHCVRERLGPHQEDFDDILCADGGEKRHAIEAFAIAQGLTDPSRIVFVDDQLDNVIPVAETSKIYGAAFLMTNPDHRAFEVCRRRGIPFAQTMEELRRILFCLPKEVC
jgi:atypical dual specificity phosphatase